MTIQAAISDIGYGLPELRREAEARMTSRATIRRRTGHTTQDETTGEESPIWETTHTGTPLRLAGSRGASPSRTVDVGGDDFQVATREAHLPHDTDNLADGDLIEVTEGECAGTVWQVVESDGADQQTARRLPVVAVDRPTEW